jgi:hypothetical protein
MNAHRSKRTRGVLSCGLPTAAIATMGEQKTDDVAGRDVKKCYLTTTTTSGTIINIIININIINFTIIIIIVVSNGITTITAPIASPIAAAPQCTYYLRRDIPRRRFSSPRGRPQRQDFWLSGTHITPTYIYPLICGRKGFISSSFIYSTYPLECGRRGFISSSYIYSTYPLECGRRGFISSSGICLACSSHLLKCGGRGLLSPASTCLASTWRPSISKLAPCEDL